MLAGEGDEKRQETGMETRQDSDQVSLIQRKSKEHIGYWGKRELGSETSAGDL